MFLVSCDKPRGINENNPNEAVPDKVANSDGSKNFTTETEIPAEAFAADSVTKTEGSNAGSVVNEKGDSVIKNEVAERSVMPEFSWDTLPLYMHIRKSKRFNTKELEYLSQFPLITLEKFTGAKSFGTTDGGIIQAAKAIKKLNPKAKVLFYRNVICHYDGYRCNKQLESVPDPFLVDKSGNLSLIRDRIKAYDTSIPELRDWWVTSARDICKSRYIDGLFLDGNIKILLHHFMRDKLPKGKKDATVEGYHEMMKQTRKALGPNKLMFANIMRANQKDCGLVYMHYFDGSYLENFLNYVPDRIVKAIEAVQKAARMGKIIAMTLSIGKTIASDGIDEVRVGSTDLRDLTKEAIDFKIALFLVCAEKYSYLYIKDGYSADVHRGKCESSMWLQSLPEYKKPLGPPKGTAKRDGYIFTREFKHASVWLDIENRKGRVAWE